MSTHPKWLKRAGMLAGVLALAVAFTAPAVASAQPKVEAAKWLASQLKPSETSSPAYCELFGSPSIGETIECELAFKAAGSEFSSKSTATYAYAVAHKSEYIGTKSCAEEGAMHAGSVAKLALGVEAEGHNPEEVGARNLIADLKCLQVKEGTENGRFKDKGTEEFSNVTTQSFAIIALKACEAKACTSKPNLKSVIEAGATYLEGQQCTKPEELAGAFRSTMGLPTTKCNTKAPFNKKEEENPNAVEVDSTGAAIQALLTVGTSGAKTSAESALKWLHSDQTLSGAWESYCSETEFTSLFKSANSTALGIMADVEDKASFGSGVKWLEEAVEGQPAGERGLPACGKTGKPDVLASVQGVLGLYEASYPHLVGLP
jgi:hypothetical protein